MSNEKTLAEKIAKDIFTKNYLSEVEGRRVTRIALMYEYMGERDGGGLCESALAKVIEDSLKDLSPYPRDLVDQLIEAAKNIDEYLSANDGLNLVGSRSILHNGLIEALEGLAQLQGVSEDG